MIFVFGVGFSSNVVSGELQILLLELHNNVPSYCNNHEEEEIHYLSAFLGWICCNFIILFEIY